jgi:hypothetical protein
MQSVANGEELTPQDQAELEEVVAWAAGVEAMQARMAERFRRPEPQGGPWPT